MRTPHNPVLVSPFLVTLLLAIAAPAGTTSAGIQAHPQSRLTEVSMTIISSTATLFAGDTAVFAATMLSGSDTSVIWSVEEEDGGTITSEGL